MGRSRVISDLNFQVQLVSKKGQAKVEFQAYQVKKLAQNDLYLRFIAAVINPADINMIEQNYIIKPRLPFCLGNEGVFEVVALGSKINSFSIGDRVIIPFKSALNWHGGWCNHCVVSSDICIKVPNYISNKLAAMLTVNPLTAWLLLDNVNSNANKQPIIQNAANSNLGRFITYFAKQRNIICINLVRSKNSKQNLPEDQQKHCFVYEKGVEKNIINHYGFCQLALNAVGGEQANCLAKTLSPYKKLITYGAMAKQPLSFGNALFIYQNIILTGFNRSRYIQENTYSNIKKTYKNMFSALKNCDDAQFPIRSQYKLADINDALQDQQSEEKNGKVLLINSN